MKNKTGIWFVLILATASGIWYYQNNSKTGQAAQSMAAGPVKTSVTTLTVKSEPVNLTISLPGRTAAFTQSQVRPQVSGIIKERLFQEGTMVTKGQPLYQLDAARYEANLKSAQANLQSAKANFKAIKAKHNRIKSLILKKAVSQQDLDDIEAQMDQAKAAISVAEAAVALEKINVDYSHVYAPISGRIGRSNLTVGALVTASQADSLATITQLNPIYVDMQASETDSILIQKILNSGQQIDVSLADNELGEVRGKLAFSDVMVSETTGSVGLRAVMQNDEGALLPGLYVNAEISLGEQESILVPQRATTRNAKGELLVWVVNDKNVANPQNIQVSRALGSNWVVTAGLQKGDSVVVEGYQRLGPGSEVEATEWQATSAKNQSNSRG